jgi:2-polyprenyl-3-methyl-5-hydroxy-6-metoxy-1,4-benzoquinol methylase
MHVGARPEGTLEWLAYQLDLAPVPIADTHVAFTAARAIMAGTSLGIFDAIANGGHSAESIAAACGTDVRATRALVDCLSALGYLRFRNGRYDNTRRVEKWLLARSPRSVRDKLLFQRVEWDLLAKLEDFVRTGKGLDLHATLREDDWTLYQNAMRALAVDNAPAVARRIPLRRRAQHMLDIGGAHGLYSAALCRLHPRLRSEVLELPAAIPRASSLLEKEGLGDRVVHRAGDVLRDDLGANAYDLVLIMNLVHHFSEEQNRQLSLRVARALRPGGAFVIGDVEKKADPRAGGAISGTMDLYFSLTSASGTWPLSAMREWQKAAGLDPRRAVRLAQMPGFVLQPARKPSRSHS